MECEEMFYFLPYSLKYGQEKDTVCEINYDVIIDLANKRHYEIIYQVLTLSN